MSYKAAFKEFFIPKFKFALTSSVATLLDYGIYLTLTMLLLTSETIAHAISYSVGMILNFLLQRHFIFTSKRKTSAIFAMSVMFSGIGWLLSQGIFNLLIYSISFFKTYDILAKILTTGTIFLYNFYTKRFSFERRMPLQDARKHLRRNKDDS
ncbi:MAG: GtrA family protein [Bacteroidetes bacterium]|nr:GtrA family protein [Bacteroidota bacterium]